MHSADASTPAPTYGMSRHSSSPCTVPSSPNGPWSAGNTTSTPSQAPAGRDLDLAAVAAPDAVAPDLDLDRHVPGLREPGANRRGRRERDLVLGRAASPEHRHAQRRVTAHRRVHDVVVGGGVVVEVVVVVVVEEVFGGGAT